MSIPPFYADELHAWYSDLQNQICHALETIEQESLALPLYDQWQPETFEKRSWDYSQSGGGQMRVLQNGRVFEKAGVNVSCVWGEFSKEFAKEIPGAEEDPRFWASGISLVIHPRNPYVPIVHMNTRHIVTTKSWFGGGADLTPSMPLEEDTAAFHQAFKECCDSHDAGYYDRFKQWCDEYFYLKHRKEMRGIGGIFYDYVNTGDFEADKAFNKSVGETFLKVYPKIVRRRMEMTWGDVETQKLQHKRSRYVEFNLIYDRGTHFGLKTGGNTDAILMSMPPSASWAA
ncbi:MAG: oxygen-dependent coproporphyrinogen oxidase [Pseudomonadota bacterium]|nr:oxygen-dependent coproporphyrinogen oxidase [Alphaproteobacteria bacterium]